MHINKLDNNQRMFVLRMYGEGMDSGKIRREIKERFGISISTSAVLQTCRAQRNQVFVRQFRDSYLSKVRDVPISQKRIRIDDLERERLSLNKMIEENPKKDKVDIHLYLQLVSELRRILETAREEMECKPHLFQNVVVGMGDMSDESLHIRKQEIIKKLRRTERDELSSDNESIES